MVSMDEIETGSVSRWLWLSPDLLVLENWLGNRRIYPSMVPQTLTQLFWEQALTIKQIRRKRRELDAGLLENKTYDLDWTSEIENLKPKTRNQKEIVSILLDGWEPSESVMISDLVSIVAPVGYLPPNVKVAAQVSVDTGLAAPQKLIIPADDIVLLPVSAGTRANLSIRLNRDLRLSKKTNLDLTVVAGKYGIVLDLRGRPISLPTPDEAGRRRVYKWREQIWEKVV
jgi:hypothetical protein